MATKINKKINTMKKHLLLFFLFSGSLDSFSRDTLKQGTPDTLRAIILVTMCRKCAAEAIPGYVVISEGKRPVYLDCRKRALRWPQVGWGYEVVGINEKVK